MTPKQAKAFDDALAREVEVLATDSLRPSKDTIAIYRDGVRETWRVAPKIAKIYEGVDIDTANALVRFFSIPSRLKRMMGLGMQ